MMFLNNFLYAKKNRNGSNVLKLYFVWDFNNKKKKNYILIQDYLYFLLVNS